MLVGFCKLTILGLADIVVVTWASGRVLLGVGEEREGREGGREGGRGGDGWMGREGKSEYQDIHKVEKERSRKRKRGQIRRENYKWKFNGGWIISYRSRKTCCVENDPIARSAEINKHHNVPIRNTTAKCYIQVCIWLMLMGTLQLTLGIKSADLKSAQKIHDITWHHMTSHDITGHHMTSQDSTWHHMTLHDITC